MKTRARWFLCLAAILSLAQNIHSRPPAYVQAPDFPPADSWIKGNHYEAKDIWLNSPPLDWKKLQGKVVLIDFWEYTCINCVRTFDYLKRWDKLYRPAGLVIIGVHAPEFDFAYDPMNVRRAAQRFGLTFPIVIDSEFRIWRSYGNNTWPNKFLIGADRRIVFNHSGEGRYAEFEQHIREALQTANPQLRFRDPIPPDHDGWGPTCGQTTEELYTGKARASNEGLFALKGNWIAEDDAQRVATPLTAGATLEIHYQGAEVVSVINTTGPKSSRLYVDQDGRPLDKTHANVDIHWDDQGRSYLIIDESRMYYVARNLDDNEHTLRLMPTQPGVGIYSFCFGNKCLLNYSHL